jgi:single-stranded-DNA-specific exonuclease
VTLEKDMVEAFRDKINEEAAKDVKEEVFRRSLDIDMDVPLNMLSEDVIKEIDKLSPFGEENPRPVLVSRNLLVRDGPRSIGKNGFKVWVTDNDITCEAVSFGRQALTVPQNGDGVDVAYIPSMNDWQGVSSIQLELKDVISQQGE